MSFNTFALWRVITLPIKQEKSSTFMLLFRILCIPKMPAPAFWLLTVVRWVTATMLLPSPAILFRVEAWQPHSDIGIPFKVNVGSKLTRVYRTFQVRFIITKPLLFYNCKILTVLCFLFRFRNKNWLFAYFVPVSERKLTFCIFCSGFGTVILKVKKNTSETNTQYRKNSHLLLWQMAVFHW